MLRSPASLCSEEKLIPVSLQEIWDLPPLISLFSPVLMQEIWDSPPRGKVTGEQPHFCS